ncbi:unnamed protein product [Soboliphyme baturini]|uniref:Aldehyde dehydrogenase n=1 Tax=Soboliphyme baturini TaxID=241478 RepID=A0A183IL62_9BILA|nr:unnamed protein product [Soboliphyme baturini]
MIIDCLRRTFDSGKTLPISFRKAQLTRLRLLLTENEQEICDAVFKDIHRPAYECYFYEIMLVLNEIEAALEGIGKWTTPQKVNRNLMQILDSAYIVKEPLGVVLIMSTWNYPINLIFAPLVGAIAAGNCVVLKPSEMASYTESLIGTLVPKYLDSDVIKVVKADAAATAELLKERFDHIFFTGSNRVGKLVLRAASEHLTPVTLELGGKCPVIVTSDFTAKIAARRIAWGKFLSCGQTCLAPDYVLCEESVKADLIQGIQAAVKDFYGANPQTSEYYARIINKDSFERLVRFIKTNNVVCGGSYVAEDLYIAPTIIDNVRLSDPIMQEEIFGPILPIISVKSVEQAIEVVKNREKPLAVYLFSNTSSVQNKIMSGTFSGACVVNDIMMHIGLETLPFGGVGYSGMGKYHGKFSFDTFSNSKSVLKRHELGEFILWMRYPPYSQSKHFWANLFIKRHPLSLAAIVPPKSPSTMLWFRNFKGATETRFRFLNYTKA